MVWAAARCCRSGLRETVRGGPALQPASSGVRAACQPASVRGERRRNWPFGRVSAIFFVSQDLVKFFWLGYTLLSACDRFACLCYAR